MITQYPHTINLTTNADSTQDSDGNWTPGSTTTVSKSCRAEPSGGNGYVRAADGERINFNWIVYLPLPQDKVKEGTLVTIFDGAEQIARDKVLRFSRGQLNARIWL
jgi:hypothetical protein